MPNDPMPTVPYAQSQARRHGLTPGEGDPAIARRRARLLERLPCIEYELGALFGEISNHEAPYHWYSEPT